jgi:broad specificity phosphatase PhoE
MYSDNFPMYEIFYVRHGETDFNDVLNSSKNPEKVRSDENFIDCSLNAKGLSQVESLSLKIKNIEIDYVFCSPLNRCLETAYHSLKIHPNKDMIRVIVSPYITEVVNSIQDVSICIKKKKEIYNENSEIKFDWSYFDACFRKEEKETYFLNFIELEDSYSEVERLIKNIRDSEEKKGLYSQLLSVFINEKKRPESLFNLYLRTHKFKKFLKNFLDSSLRNSSNEREEEKVRRGDEFFNKEKTKKVFVFTHSGFIRMSTGNFTKPVQEVSSYPRDCLKPRNCEMVSIDLTNI